MSWVNWTEKSKDKVALFIPLLWLAFFALIFTGNGLYSMYPVLLVASINMILGISEGEKINRSLFWVWFVGWTALMCVAITGMNYYYFKFGNNAPDFLMFGMHPSFFFLIGVLWLGGFVYLGFSFCALKDIWLPRKKWDDFLTYASSLSKEERGEE